MTIITRVGIAAILVAIALPFVSAGHESRCKSSEFWFDEKKCCLPHGGPHKHHTPPTGKKCPSEHWSWSHEHHSCVPHYPHYPLPECDKGWDWLFGDFWCEEHHHHHHPPHPEPSGHFHVNRGEHGHGSSSCKKEEFWFEEKKCCLPHGGPHKHHTPPTGKKCPSEHWSWSHEHHSCVPHYPHYPLPECDKGWVWLFGDFWCEEHHHHHHHHHPEPSGRHDGGWKRSLAMPRDLCPIGLNACPIAGANGLTGDFECLDTTNELESCGGCSSVDEGQDCTAIQGAWNVGCEQGSCAIYTCAAGYRRSVDGKSCVEL